MQNMNYKEAFAKYGHIAAISICVVFNLMWYVMAGDPEAAEIQTDAEELIAYIDRAMRDNSIPKGEASNYGEIVQKNWNIDMSLNAAPNYTNIYPAAKYNFIPEVAPADQWINKPSQININVEREKININWGAPNSLRDENGNSRQMSKLEGYELVQTWKNIQGKEQVKTIIFDSYTRQYEDTNVEAKIQYSYKVRAYTKNKKARGGKNAKIKNEDVVVSDYTETVKGEIQSQFEMELMGVAGQTAFLKLRKWQKGDWREHNCQIKKGEEIKAEDIKTSIGKVNFIPNWQLIEVTDRAPKTITRKVKKTIFNPDPQTVYEEKKVTVYLRAIIYKDEKGIKQKLYGK